MIVHKNQWWWGISETIIADGGMGVVEIQFDYDMPNTGFIKGLSVLEEHRHKGVGMQLLVACASRAKFKFRKNGFISQSYEAD